MVITYSRFRSANLHHISRGKAENIKTYGNDVTNLIHFHFHFHNHFIVL
jgi:hypothetical protein